MEMMKNWGISCSERTSLISRQRYYERKTLEKVTGLSQDYSAEEVMEFMIFKILKICGYSYEEIKLEMIEYKKDKTAVLDKAIV